MTLRGSKLPVILRAPRQRPSLVVERADAMPLLCLADAARSALPRRGGAAAAVETAVDGGGGDGGSGSSGDGSTAAAVALCGCGTNVALRFHYGRLRYHSFRAASERRGR